MIYQWITWLWLFDTIRHVCYSAGHQWANCEVSVQSLRPRMQRGFLGGLWRWAWHHGSWWAALGPGTGSPGRWSSWAGRTVSSCCRWVVTSALRPEPLHPFEEQFIRLDDISEIVKCHSNSLWARAFWRDEPVLKAQSAIPSCRPCLQELLSSMTSNCSLLEGNGLWHAW